MAKPSPQRAAESCLNQRADVFRGNRYPDALNDLQRAMQYVKAHAEEMGIDASHVAAMGFSAGGHLVMQR